MRAGGSSLRDHMQTNGELGYFQKEFAAYDREGQPCMRRGCHGRDQTHRTKRTFNILLSNMPGLLNELTIRATNVILRGDDVPIWNALKRAKDARHYDEGAKTFGWRRAYGVFWATAIPSTSLGSAGVCLGNTRALVACSKS